MREPEESESEPPYIHAYIHLCILEEHLGGLPIMIQLQDNYIND